MHVENCDVIVIGAGPGGLAAAMSAKKNGASKVIVLERNDIPGGILNQCIHEGFGLYRYSEILTGPEYAKKAIDEADDSGVIIRTNHHVSQIFPNKDVVAYTRNGVFVYRAKSIVLATGCRERTRGAISVPGSRPAGVYTAGVAQNLINIHKYMIGNKAVILGSGDIGLIMARRLTLCGAEVAAVCEIADEPTGLARNVSQCLYKYDIPLFVNTTVSRIIGKQRIEAVELSEVDKKGRYRDERKKVVACDTLILSVGLIPENELALSAGVELYDDNSVKTDDYLQTSVKGIFSCGNSRRVMDLADYVSEQGEIAGRNAASCLTGASMEKWKEEKTNPMKKGFPDKDTITCIICRSGCQIKYIVGIFEGNGCKRGIEFAKSERGNYAGYSINVK